MQRAPFYILSLIASAALATPTLARSPEASLTINGSTVDLSAGVIPGLFGDGGPIITQDELVTVNDIKHYGIYTEKREEAQRLAIDWFRKHLHAEPHAN